MSERPAPWLRRLFRLPVPLFRAGLGRRVMRGAAPWIAITTRGRQSGEPRVVLVDCLYEETPNGPWYVQSTYGENAGWVRNLVAHPLFEIESGVGRFAARARFLDGAESLAVMRRAVAGHALYIRMLGVFMGARVFSSEELARWFAGKFLTLEIRHERGASGSSSSPISSAGEP